MDPNIATGLLDQAIGGVIAILLVQHVEKKLDQISLDLQALTKSIDSYKHKEDEPNG